jgi:hypothetical protein
MESHRCLSWAIAKAEFEAMLRDGTAAAPRVLGLPRCTSCPRKTTMWLHPVGGCFGSPPGGRNEKGSPHWWWDAWRRPLRIATWNPGVVPGWGWGAAIRRCGW